MAKRPVVDGVYGVYITDPETYYTRKFKKLKFQRVDFHDGVIPAQKEDEEATPVTIATPVLDYHKSASGWSNDHLKYFRVRLRETEIETPQREFPWVKEDDSDESQKWKMYVSRVQRDPNVESYVDDLMSNLLRQAGCETYKLFLAGKDTPVKLIVGEYERKCKAEMYLMGLDGQLLLVSVEDKCAESSDKPTDVIAQAFATVLGIVQCNNEVFGNQALKILRRHITGKQIRISEYDDDTGPTQPAKSLADKTGVELWYNRESLRENDIFPVLVAVGVQVVFLHVHLTPDLLKAVEQGLQPTEPAQIDVVAKEFDRSIDKWEGFRLDNPDGITTVLSYTATVCQSRQQYYGTVQQKLASWSRSDTALCKTGFVLEKV